LSNDLFPVRNEKRGLNEPGSGWLWTDADRSPKAQLKLSVNPER